MMGTARKRLVIVKGVETGNNLRLGDRRMTRMMRIYLRCSVAQMQCIDVQKSQSRELSRRDREVALIGESLA